MANILVIDNFCPKPYSDITLQTEAMGGTEATVVRVTSGLAKRGHRVFVAQRRRKHREVLASGVVVIPFVFKGIVYAGHPADIDAVIVLNSFKLLKAVREQFQNAKLYLWMHCFPGKNRKRLAAITHAYDVSIVGVSKTHADHICQFLSGYQTDPTVYPAVQQAPEVSRVPSAVTSFSVSKGKHPRLYPVGFARGSVARAAIARDPVAQNSVARDPVAQNPVAQNPVAQNPVAQGPVQPHGNIYSEQIIPLPRVTYVYNPVEVDSKHTYSAEPSDYDPNKLVFFSSPHKGLSQVLATFEQVRQRWPQIELYVANPGYLELDPSLSATGVHVLGSLPSHELHQHVKSALCVFYPQSQFAETFGLVFAEANALGTPVLAHDLGSAREVLGDSYQLVDATQPQDVIARLAQWRSNGRPRVSLKPDFTTAAVVRRWETLIAAPVQRTTARRAVPKTARKPGHEPMRETKLGQPQSVHVKS